MEQIPSQINQMSLQVASLKSAGLDVRVKNKVAALLWEAAILAEHLLKPDELAARAALDASAPAACMCEPGVRDRNCPAH